MESVSCGIVIYDELELIKKNIPLLQIELANLDVEWIFILNHESAAQRLLIKNWLIDQIPTSLILENPSNHLALARQLILSLGTSPWIYFMDPDIEIDSGSVRELLRQAVNSDMQLIGLGGKVKHRSSNLSLDSTFNLMDRISKWLPFAFQIQNHSYLKKVDHLPTCHLLLSRKNALAIGGFSKNFNRYGEDLDFSHRAHNQKYHFLFSPSASVQHEQNLLTLEWMRKIFNFGRIQIAVQKLNYKQGLRFYRLFPLLIFFAVLTTHFWHPTLMIVIDGFVLLTCFLFEGLTGLALTFLAYTIGEAFELISPTSAHQSEEEWQASMRNFLEQHALAKTKPGPDLTG